ncbi:MAG: AhpC/TSA family protein [Bacteroidetes bacterium]|nr:AhpC/TSA family protein [Bacteroidota bacterium]
MPLFDVMITTLLVLPLGSMFAQTRDTAETAVPKTAEAVCPLKPGMTIPSVRLAGTTGSGLALRDAVEKQPAVIIFYRGGWCPFCSVQLGQLQAIEQELREMGVQLIGISPDTPEHLMKSASQHSLRYTLLSDSDMEAAKQFGIAYELDARTVTSYREHNLDIEAASGKTHHMLPVPAVFVVNREGRITFTYVNPDYKVRLDPQLLLAAARTALDS